MVNFSQYSNENALQHRAAVTQQHSHHYSHHYLTVPTSLCHQLHNKHYYCEFTASLCGRRCPRSCVTVYRWWEQHPPPNRVTGHLLRGSKKFALHERVGAFWHAVGTQTGACCNTMGIPVQLFPIP